MLNLKPIHIAILAAVLSGVSVFVNGLAVKNVDPFAFTTLKNALVGVAVLAFLLLASQWTALRSLNRSQLKNLLIIATVGGSVPFLLFFWGLSLSSGAIGSLVYRLMFLFASGIAIFYLKEKLNAKLIVGGVLLLIGNMLLLKGSLAFGFGEVLILLATVFWAIEANLSKKAMQELPSNIVLFGRMFLGSLIMIGILALFGKAESLFSLSPIALGWVAITAVFLLGYVALYYSALSRLPVSIATPVLALGGPTTAILSVAFAGKIFAPLESFGFLLIVAGVVLVSGVIADIKSFISSRFMVHG